VKLRKGKKSQDSASAHVAIHCFIPLQVALKKRQRVAGKSRRHPFQPVRNAPLKTVPHTDFRSKSMRQSHAARCNKPDRFSKGVITKVTVEVVAEIGAIGQIKELDESGNVVTLANLEVLRHARIKLEERLTAEIGEGGKLTLPGS
jgi:hypothetical protein